VSSSVPTESSTTLLDNIQLNEEGDFTFIGEGIRIGSSNGSAVFATADFVDVSVDGEAVGFVGVFADSNGAHFSVGAQGVLWGGVTGLLLDGTDGQIFNSGTVFGAEQGIELEQADGAQIHNTGRIISGRLSDFQSGAITILGETGAKHLIDNSGSISTQLANGNAIIATGNSAETVSNTGSIKGRISLDLGNDLLDTSHGTVAGVIDMGGGNDTVRGSAAADNILGGFGNDQLIGNSGNDILRGGAGVDLIAGGAGADRFVFTSGDSGVAAAAQDRVTDFSHAQADHIDLRLFDANMKVANDQAFTHHAGELHYAVSGGNAFVSGDADGNGVADFTIRLDHVTSLVASDFFL